MKKRHLALWLVIITLLACKNQTNLNKNNIEITPIEHASFILSYNATHIYIDPVGDIESFKNEKQPHLVLVTDIHGDHLNTDDLSKLIHAETKILAPKAVYNNLPNTLKKKTIIINNNETKSLNVNTQPIQIKAIPMYNLRKEALKFHEKGRGNGYVLTLNSKRIYISGDTEDIPEMRTLKHIDMAFVCMNLPYTMPIENAADAVLSFKPQTVYPYHYRGTDGFSDVNQFKNLVNTSNKNINVVLLDWYPK